MARVVYKYPFPSSARGALDELQIAVPRGSRPVHFGDQAGHPTVWVEQEQAPANDEAWRLVIRGTGHPLPDGDGWQHVGSFVTPGGSFVFHCYARRTA